MPTTLPMRRVERRSLNLAFTFVALAMWGASLLLFGLDPSASAETGSVLAFTSP